MFKGIPPVCAVAWHIVDVQYTNHLLLSNRLPPKLVPFSHSFRHMTVWVSNLGCNLLDGSAHYPEVVPLAAIPWWLNSVVGNGPIHVSDLWRWTFLNLSRIIELTSPC